MNIFLHELKAYRKTTMIWTAALIGVALMYLVMYPSFSKDMSQINKMVLDYPKALRDALGLSLSSFSTLLGFYGFILTFITLCGAIQAMNIGTSILSKEVRERTADFLMTKPVSRITIMTSKLLSSLVTLLLSNIVFLGVVFAIAKLVSSTAFNNKKFILLTLTLFLVELMFLCLGILISVIARKIKSVISITMGVVFGFYIISMLGSVIGEKNVRYITPFKFFDPNYIIAHASFESRFVIIEILFVIISLALSYVLYFKKDIHAV